jgi:hypothetical protein
VIFSLRSFLVFVIFSYISCSHAGLGDEVKKIQDDKVLLKAQSLKVIQKEKFSIYEIQVPEYKIREYVNSDRKVFAVAWSGFTHPQMKQVLSSYYDEFLEVAQNQKRTHGQRFRVVKTKNLTVMMSGHMRNLKGKAYLHKGLPLGVNIYEIR